MNWLDSLVTLSALFRSVIKRESSAHPQSAERLITEVAFQMDYRRKKSRRGRPAGDTISESATSNQGDRPHLAKVLIEISFRKAQQRRALRA